MAETTKTTTSRLDGLAERAHGLVDQAVEGTSSGTQRAARAVHRQIDSATTGATAAADWMTSQVDEYTRRPQELLDSACETIRARPLMSVGIAIAAGYLIGRMAR
jgi:ElaB/YqjD/DUF883 family membrane-anchored ribosome-binding protein